MLKSMLIYQRDSKGIVKSNFVTSCLTFRGSIPTIMCLEQSLSRYCSLEDLTLRAFTAT